MRADKRRRSRSVLLALPEDLHELHEHLAVGLERGGHDVLVWAVVAAPYGPELDPRHAGSLEIDDIAGAVASDADGVAAEVPRGHLAQNFDVGVRVGDVGRFAAEQDLELGGQVYGTDLADDLLRVLVRQVADVQVVGAAVGHPVQDVPADDTRQVHARVREELVPLLSKRQFGDAAVVLVGQEDRVLAEPRRRAVRALAAEGDAEVEDALGLGADVEVGGFAGDEKVANVAVLDEDLRARRSAVLLLLVGDHEELDRGVATHGGEVLDGVHHRRESPLHVVDAPAVELAVLLVGLELPLLAGHDVGVAVQEYAGLSRAHPHHEGGQVPLGTGAPVPDRLQASRLEPPVDEVDRRPGDARGVRSEANQPPRQGEYVSAVLRYGQVPLRSLA